MRMAGNAVTGRLIAMDSGWDQFCEVNQYWTPARSQARRLPRRDIESLACSLTGIHERRRKDWLDQWGAFSKSVRAMVPISAGVRAMATPAFSKAVTLLSTLPMPRWTMAPAWPIRFPSGVFRPAT